MVPVTTKATDNNERCKFITPEIDENENKKP